MTDKEIIKALECCSMGSYPACRDCPYHDDYVNRGCINKRNADIKDLINRQKAEIDELVSEKDKLKREFIDVSSKLLFTLDEKQRCKKEIENLNGEILAMRKTASGYRLEICRLKTAKAEAVKEFAEEIENINLSNSDDYFEFKRSRFDNLLKEKVGDE